MPEKMEKQSFKIFVGNVSKKAKDSEIRELFQKYGPVLETNIIRDYAFVHMENEEQGREAIKNLDSTLLHDTRIKCQPAVSRKTTESSHSIKLFLGNLSEKMKPDEIRDLFKDYGKVIELDIIRTYGFIHIEPNCDSSKIIRDLHLKHVDGQPIKVQLSTSRVRQKPGMGNSEQCYRCGRVGHWSRECPKLADVDRVRLSRGYSATAAAAAAVPSSAAAYAAAAADTVPTVYDRDHRYSHLRSSGSARYDDFDRYYDRLPLEMPPSSASARSLNPYHHRHHDPYDIYGPRSSAAGGVYDPYKMRSSLDYDPLMGSRPRGVSDYALYDNYGAMANPRQPNDPLLYGSHASSYGRRYAPY